MEYIWLIIIVAIILKNLGRLMDRYGSRGKLDFPREELPFDADELLLESTPSGEMYESETEYDLPEYPAARGGELTVIIGDSGNEGRQEGRQEGPAGKRRPAHDRDTGTRREIGGHCGVEEMFDGGIGQGEFIKGMVWSQILGPRGGIQASKRLRYR